MPTEPAIFSMFQSQKPREKGAKFSIAQIPTLRDVSKDVVRIEEKTIQMAEQRAQLEAERLALVREANEDNSLAKRQKARDDAMVAAALGEAPVTGPGDLSSDLAHVMEKIRVIDLAIRLMRNQLDIAKREASVLVCQQVSDVHESLAREMATSLLAVHRACVDYRAFANAMESRDVEWGHLKPTFPRFLGEPGDPYSPLAIYVRQVIEDGRLDETEVPKEIRLGVMGWGVSIL